MPTLRFMEAGRRDHKIQICSLCFGLKLFLSRHRHGENDSSEKPRETKKMRQQQQQHHQITIIVAVPCYLTAVTTPVVVFFNVSDHTFLFCVNRKQTVQCHH
jgi:hypothetical protein